VTVLLRVVIDPNVFVSAAISAGGATAAIVDLIDAGVIVPVVSPRLLGELDGVLRREKFRAWLTIDQVNAFVTELERLAESADDPDHVPSVSPDPDDDYLLALARTTQADALVSGDPDLTELTLDDLPVVTPRELLDELTAALNDDATHPEQP
jgi:putative PIN family toxin of toxin-antitoxin system